ncbi:hypothetical protein D1159_08175 [Pseudoflavonifractor sp. 524-17]|uniref:hypothetical protein n=1 Tax=Pseudoflavonifractor sp. 524-17 TaxID=2304577 RepID=UPI00137AF83B|nr:hypothetical protein [Pseudoflavonifractor sp. 524-17]NCE64563.1 hypothetical protein [Pseudoflavonifractor sp. 524-17]
MERSKEELSEAKRQIDSIIHKLKEAKKTLLSKENPKKYQSQITLAERRIQALELANTLIADEMARK